MRTLVLPAGESPRQWGQRHGSAYPGEIRSLAALRVYLTRTVGGFSSDAEVLRVARAHLPVLASYDDALYQELLGIAEGAGVTPEEIVVLNHYTDLRDLDASAVPEDGGCSVVRARTPTGDIVAQTWDMHATAIPYVMMLRTPDAWLLSLTGCLGMAGMNRNGVAIAINNLHSTDARVGVVWSALVRVALRMKSAADARDAVLSAPIGSGHHYLVAEPGAAFGIETSGTTRELLYLGEPDWYVHTNHCLAPAVADHSRVPPQSTSPDRYDWLHASLEREPVRDLADVWARLGSEEGYPRSVCTNMATPEQPHKPATCGAIAMNLDTRQVWAAPGLIHNVEADRFDFESEPA